MASTTADTLCNETGRCMALAVNIQDSMTWTQSGEADSTPISRLELVHFEGECFPRTDNEILLTTTSERTLDRERHSIYAVPLPGLDRSCGALQRTERLTGDILDDFGDKCLEIELRHSNNGTIGGCPCSEERKTDFGRLSYCGSCFRQSLIDSARKTINKVRGESWYPSAEGVCIRSVTPRDFRIITEIDIGLERCSSTVTEDTCPMALHNCTYTTDSHGISDEKINYMIYQNSNLTESSRALLRSSSSAIQDPHVADGPRLERIFLASHASSKGTKRGFDYDDDVDGSNESVMGPKRRIILDSVDQDQAQGQLRSRSTDVTMSD